MTTTQEILAAAMALPREARAQLAEQLLDSLDLQRAEIDAAWETEIEARISEIETGRAQLIPHDQAVAGVRERLA
ncbi:MAG TPA: addiction module protein [Tepidisphaeraceae bacterium]|jgi:putative addiction module component (TIGR02574 family)